jgi:hypothetical protein
MINTSNLSVEPDQVHVSLARRCFAYLTVSARLPALRKWPKAPGREEVTLASWTEEKPVLTREERP